jgi:GTPase SAR1 family protein
VARGSQGQRPSLSHLHLGRQQAGQTSRVKLILPRRKVTYEEGLRFAKDQGIAFLETSAKTGNNVSEIFTVITECILSKIEDQQVEARNHPGVKIGN